MPSPAVSKIVDNVRESLAQSELEPKLARLEAALERGDLTPVDRGVLLSTKAIATRHSGDLDATATLLAEAVNLLEGSTEYEGLLRAQTAAAGTALARNNAEDALDYAVDALRLIDQPIIRKEAIPPAASNLGHVFREFAAFDLAVQLAELAYRTAQAGHSPTSLPLVSLNLAHSALEGRRLLPDLDQDQRATWLALAQEAGLTMIKTGQNAFETHVLGHGTMAEVAMENDDLAAARRHIDQALSAIDVASTLLASVVRLAHGMLLRREGRAAEAVTALNSAEEGLRDEYLPFTRLLRERSLTHADLQDYRQAHADSFLLAQLAETRRASQVGQLADQVMQRAQLETAKETLTLETDRLTTMAHTDAVTGLASRQRLEAHMQAHEYRTGTVSVLLVDLDQFKSVNDSHGHIVGDHVLRDVGEILTSTCRSADVVARFGGDEFVALASDLDEEGAVAMAQRIQDRFDNHDWTAAGCDVRVSASIGCAAGQSRDLTDLLTQADKRLYKAKADGRNRVIST